MTHQPIWKELGYESEEAYREHEAENERMAKSKGFTNYAAYEKAKYTELAYKLDERYDLYKDIEDMAEWAKTHNPREKPHKDYWYSYMDLDIKSLDEMPRRLAIYKIRTFNRYREGNLADEYIEQILNINMEKVAHKGYLKIMEDVIGEMEGDEQRKEYQKERERLEKAPIPISLEGKGVYDMFSSFVDFMFMNWIYADYFTHEQELLMEDTVFETS